MSDCALHLSEKPIGTRKFNHFRKMLKNKARLGIKSWEPLPPDSIDTYSSLLDKGRIGTGML